MNNLNKINQIRATLALTKASLISLFRNPSALVFSLIFPMVFIVIFGLIGGDSTEITTYLTKSSNKQNPIYESLENLDNIKFKNYKNEELAKEDLKIGNIDSIIDIAKQDFSPYPKYTINLLTSDAAPEKGQLIKSVISSVSQNINLEFVDKNALPISLVTETIEGRKYKAIDFILPGQLGFALLSNGIFGTAFVLIILKETLVLKRFFAAPIKKSDILIAEGISRLLFGLLQAIVIIAFGYLFFDFTLIHGFSTFIQMILIAICGLIVFLGIGLFVSSISKDQNSVPAIANLFTLPQFLLAGTFFSIDLFPKWLQPISEVLPLTHLNNALRAIAFEGADIATIFPNLLALCIWAIIIYTTTAFLFKWNR